MGMRQPGEGQGAEHLIRGTEKLSGGVKSLGEVGRLREGRLCAGCWLRSRECRHLCQFEDGRRVLIGEFSAVGLQLVQNCRQVSQGHDTECHGDAL